MRVRTGTSVRRVSAGVLALALTLTISLGGVSAASSVSVVTVNEPPCVDCSIPERDRPSSMTLATTRHNGLVDIVIELTHANWRSWGGTNPNAAAVARVNVIDAQFRGIASIPLDMRRTHLRDGCGNRGARLIYTRGRVRLSRMNDSTLDGTYVVPLARTGCETS